MNDKSGIAPPGQEGWREAPGWWINHHIQNMFFGDIFMELEQPPRLRLRRSHPSWPGGVIDRISY